MVSWELATLQRYYDDGGDDVLRLEHYDDEITADGTIVEIGACTGAFTEKLAQRFPCHIVAFEPIDELYREARERLGDYPVTLWPMGVTAHGGAVRMGSDGAASRVDIAGDVLVNTISIDSLLVWHPVIALLIVNIEGAEYGLLDRLLEFNGQIAIRNMQIQFHDYIPDADKRMEAIQDRLAVTHELTYQYPFVFENWRRR